MPLFRKFPKAGAKASKIKVSVANPRQATHDAAGIKYPRWHAKNPKNAVIVPPSVAPTKG